MAVAGVETAAAESATKASSDSKALASDFDDFLTLLTTQLQYQDPMDPMDSSEFTNQLVQFSGVEQQIQTNENLENLTNIVSLSSNSNAINFLGETALIESPFGELKDGGSITWEYSNSSVLEEVKLQVMDTSGNIVYEEEGNPELGLHDYEWDGTKSNGEPAEPGTYKMNIEATNEDGDEIDVAIGVYGDISSFDTVNGEPYFTIGPNYVAQSAIVQVLARN